VCGAKRTCATLGCPGANDRCVDVSGLGSMMCIQTANGCAMQCPFNEECRPDPRGPQFPSVCAPKPIFGTPVPPGVPPPSGNGINSGNTGTDGTDAPTPGGLELWVILVIVGASLVVIMVCFCVIAAIIISRNRATASEREAANSSAGVGMYSFNGGGTTGGPPTHGQGSSYPAPGGAYPSGMGATTPSGSAVYSTGTQNFTREELPAF
jgi:hypothetical protein